MTSAVSGVCLHTWTAQRCTQLQKYLNCLTQFIPRGEDGRAQAGVVMGVCKGSKIVLQSAVSEVECHQAATHAKQQQEEDRDHHRRHVS